MSRARPRLRARGRAEAVVRRYWAGTTPRAGSAVLTLLAAPLAVLHATLARLRNFGYDRGLLRTVEGPIPTVSVGNLTVGGTGKTPVTGWIVSLLLEAGERPGVISRGFGEDELLLHRRWHPNVPVLQAPKRIEGVRAAAESGCTVAVVDDGFQHRALARELDVVLLSPAHRLPARSLPRGPFREPLRSLRRADLVLVTAKGASEARAARELARELHRLPGSPWPRVLELGAGPWLDLDGSPAPPPIGAVLCVASVAQPDGFVALVEERLGGTRARGVELLAYPDHHPYTPDDLLTILDRAGDRTVVTTEKDAVKLVPLVTSRGTDPEEPVRTPGTEGPPTPAGTDRFRVLPLEVVGPSETIGPVRARLRDVIAGSREER